MDWLAQLPDLNPIKNECVDFKRWIFDQKSRNKDKYHGISIKPPGMDSHLKYAYKVFC